MSMHIEGPWLSTTGKKKGKQKFKSAEAARKASELDASWEELKKKYSTNDLSKKINTSSTYGKLPSVQTPYRRETPHIPSLNSGAGVATKAAPKVYTGTLIKGIATMHKSNAVPILNDQDAIDIAKMRR